MWGGSSKGWWCSLVTKDGPVGAASAAASLSGWEKGLLLSIAAGSWISTASQVPKKNVVSVCSVLHSDGACCLHSSSRPLCLAWNPNLNNHGMVRLPKLHASKTRSLLYTYCVALLRNAPGWVESRDCMQKVLLLSVFCWGPQHYWVGLFSSCLFFLMLPFHLLWSGYILYRL